MEKLRENKKLMIIAGYVLLGTITICCIISTVISNKKVADIYNEKNNNVEQKEDEVKSSAEISNFAFTTTDAIFENGTSEFITTIKNIGNEPSYLNEFSIVVSNQNGEELVRVYGVVDKELAPQEEITVNSSYGGDLSNYGKLDYVIEQ